MTAGFSPQPSVNWDDPCERFRALRDAYFNLSQGTKVASVSYTSNGVSRAVTYSITNLTNLKQELDKAEAECFTGKKMRRFASVAGHRRTWP